MLMDKHIDGAKLVINPRRACAARVTVLGLCVCVIGLAKNLKRAYRFPVDPAQRQKWVAAVHRKNWSLSEYSRVCSNHFVSSKFIISM